jgi:hypothetical protein
MVPGRYRRDAGTLTSAGPSRKWPASRSSIAPNTLGESMRGTHIHSMLPLGATSAIVSVSERKPYSPIGGNAVPPSGTCGARSRIGAVSMPGASGVRVSAFALPSVVSIRGSIPFIEGLASRGYERPAHERAIGSDRRVHDHASISSTRDGSAPRSLALVRLIVSDQGIETLAHLGGPRFGQPTIDRTSVGAFEQRRCRRRRRRRRRNQRSATGHNHLSPCNRCRTRGRS